MPVSQPNARRRTVVTGSVAPEFVCPVDGAVGVDTSRPFSWTPADGADSYRLHIGSNPGGNDRFAGGEMSTTNCQVRGLPQAGHRVLAQSATGAVVDRFPPRWRFEGRHRPAIRVEGSGHGARLSLEGRHVARSRRSRRQWGDPCHPAFCAGPPGRGPAVWSAGNEDRRSWSASDFTFTVAGASTSMAPQIAAALWATRFVREMASEHHRRFGWTELSRIVPPRYNAVCTDYAAVLLRILGEMNVAAPARRLDVAFNPNRFEMHRLVELFDSETERWIVLDPTFALAPRLAGGGWATADDIFEAAHSFEWNRIEYVFVGAQGNAHAKGYYLDYPLLFLNVYHEGQPMPLGVGLSPLPYLEAVSLPVESSYDFYTVRGTFGDSVEVAIDGVAQELRCDGVDGLSKGFGASSIRSPARGPASFFRFRRFVF